MVHHESKEERSGFIEGVSKPFSRRKFLGIVGAGSALVVVGASCQKDPIQNDRGINLGSGDIGILNYAYALEQLEAAFYMQVIATPFSQMSAMETTYLTDIRDHEIAHREFFKAALGAKAIPGLEVDFSSIDFTSRTSVLGTAQAFEDLGVSAYNGAGKLLDSADYLTLAGKIVSVEARHAAWIRDTIAPGSFADATVVDMNGLDVSRMPDDVLTIAGAYLKSELDASNLPTE